LVNADREESELDLRLYPEESEDESWYDPAGDAVEGADRAEFTLVSRKVAVSGRGALVGFGEPKLPNNEGSVTKSSAKNTPGLFAASSGRFESRKSRSVSGLKCPDISESKMNGGELAEYAGSAEVCMTPSQFFGVCGTIDGEPCQT